MNILVTAGNTHAPIDRVRVLTNIFTGKTGANAALCAYGRGHRVTILTSHPDTLGAARPAPEPVPGETEPRLRVVPFATFDDLAGLLQAEVRAGGYDAIFHAAAVSDYLSAGVYAPAPGSFFSARTRQWDESGGHPAMVEQKAGKIKSHEPELWLRLVRAPKLVDRVRSPWGFKGVLVKFKLEVGLGDQELVRVAEESRAQSGADLMVANTLEGAAHYAYVGPTDGQYDRVPRRELAERLVLTVEHIHRNRG